MPKELADTIVKLASTIFDQSWRLSEVAKDWREKKGPSYLKKNKEEDSGSKRPISIISIPRKVTEQPVLETRSGGREHGQPRVQIAQPVPRDRQACSSARTSRHRAGAGLRAGRPGTGLAAA